MFFHKSSVETLQKIHLHTYPLVAKAEIALSTKPFRDMMSQREDRTHASLFSYGIVQLSLRHPFVWGVTAPQFAWYRAELKGTN